MPFMRKVNRRREKNEESEQNENSERGTSVGVFSHRSIYAANQLEQLPDSFLPQQNRVRKSPSVTIDYLNNPPVVLTHPWDEDFGVFPTPRQLIKPAKPSSPVEGRDEGHIFEEFLITEVPKLTAIIYAEFDKSIGPVAKFQVPQTILPVETFNCFSGNIIPKDDMFNKMIKVIFDDYKIIGHPIGLDCEGYTRGRHIFNMCFVVPANSEADCMYEPLVQKLAEYLTEMEQECFYLTRPAHSEELPALMHKIYDGINNNGECVLKVTDLSTMYLKLCPAYKGQEPPKVSLYMVPILTRRVDRSNFDRIVEKMDVLSQKIIPQIDGVRCVREIAERVEIDVDLVIRCIRNLLFYEIVSLVPLFLYSNTYVATEKLHPFYHNPRIIEECLEFVRLRDVNGVRMPSPKYPDVFRLYLSLRCGTNLREWVKMYDPRKYGVDERRLIQFGIFHKFLRKLSVYPIAKERSRGGKFVQQCDGTQCIEDLAVSHGVQPELLLEMLEASKKFELICK